MKKKKTKTSLRNNWTIKIPKFGVKPITQPIKNLFLMDLIDPMGVKRGNAEPQQ